VANDHTYGTVPVTDLLPQRGLRSAPIAALGGLLNWLLANGAVACKILHKGLPDTYGPGIAFLAGVGIGVPTEMLAAPVRIPVISTAHAFLYCRARVTVGGAGAAQITFKTALAGGTLNLPSGVAGPINLAGVVAVAAAGVVEDLTVQLAGDVGADITVHSIEVFYLEVADPIPAGTDFSGAQAFGLVSLAADNAADAGLNDALVDAAAHVRDRPRVHACDVAIATAVGGDGQLLDRVHATWATLFRGSVLRELEFTCWVYADRPTPPDDARVYLLVGDVVVSQHYPIPITADGWSSLAFTLDTEGPVVEALPVPSVFFSVWPAPAGEEPFGKTTAILYSYTVWGP
jgi:hypothetical protein